MEHLGLTLSMPAKRCLDCLGTRRDAHHQTSSLLSFQSDNSKLTLMVHDASGRSIGVGTASYYVGTPDLNTSLGSQSMSLRRVTEILETPIIHPLLSTAVLRIEVE